MDEVPKWKQFVADRWMSWLLELTVLSFVAFFTISETRKTNEQTREMLARYDAAISEYFSERATRLDETVSSAAANIKDKAQSTSLKDLKDMVDELRSSGPSDDSKE